MYRYPRLSTSVGITPTCTHFWCYVGHGGDVPRRSPHNNATAVPVPIGLEHGISSTINRYFMIGHDLKIISTRKCEGFLAARQSVFRSYLWTEYHLENCLSIPCGKSIVNWSAGLSMTCLVQLASLSISSSSKTMQVSMY